MEFEQQVKALNQKKLERERKIESGREARQAYLLARAAEAGFGTNIEGYIDSLRPKEKPAPTTKQNIFNPWAYVANHYKLSTEWEKE